MKLYATTTSEQGKAVSKSGNLFIKTEMTIDKNPFVIMIVDDKGFVYIKDYRHITIAQFLVDKKGILHKC